MNESIHSDPLATASDPELERILADAYDAPAVPSSLLGRIDGLVAAEWGRSPGLVPHRAARLRSVAERGLRRVGTWRVAAGVVLLVAVGWLLRSNSPAYAWSTMTEALRRQGMVQAADGEATRWLSLEEGVVGGRTHRTFWLLDLNQKTSLERVDSAPEIRRRKLDALRWNQQALVLGFLLGDSFANDQLQRLAELRIVDENWRPVEVAGEPRIALKVRLEGGAAEPIALEIDLDPKTHLPITCEVERAGTVQTLDLSYPPTNVAALRERELPAILAVVDVGDDPETVLAEADANANDSKQDAVPLSRRQAEAQAENAGPDLSGKQAAPAGGDAALFAAPSKWRPAPAVDLSGGETVQRIDALLESLWKEHKVSPAEPAEDSEQLRRAYLDLVGRTPSVHEARSYLNDRSPDRYERLVDRLLKSPDHASHIAAVWRSFLIPEGVDLTRFGGIEAFDQWLAKQIADNEPYDEIVQSLLLAEGRLSRSGPLLFYSALKLDPDQLASRTARVFLGMRLECAQCHDHPFEPWTQKDFWGLAAFFAQISRPRGDLESASTVMQVRDVNRGEVMLPDTNDVVAPKTLSESGISTPAEASRRRQLAQWLTSDQNPYFARAAVNRVWGHVFGKGIVDPVDDFGVQNSPASPELLDLLAGRFIHTGFDLRELFRTVALTRAYRLSSGAAEEDPKRLKWFAQMHVKTLTAEQIHDCIAVAAMLDSAPQGDPSAVSLERFGNASREAFIQQFRTPGGSRTDYLAGIPQALTLMNGSLIQGATGLASSGLLKSLEAPFFTNAQRIEVLYLATLSRTPRPSEWELLREYISEDATGEELQLGLADVLWALLNSAEFTFNH